jgi:hypothetical protein
VTLPRWQEQFGESWDVPRLITDEPGIVDLSWHHDSAPTFTFEELNVGSGELDDVRLWVEHPDRDARESEHAARFAVIDHHHAKPLYEGDNAALALEHLRAARTRRWVRLTLADWASATQEQRDEALAYAARLAREADERRARRADISIDNQGTIVRFTILTEAASVWVADNVQLESYQWLGGRSFAVDRRFAPALVEGLAGAGLQVVSQ